MSERSVESRFAQKDRVFAGLAVRHRFVGEEDVRKAREVVETEYRAGREISLEQAFITLGLLSQKQLDALRLAESFLHLRESEQIFVKVALKAGPAGQKEIDEALRVQGERFKGKRELISLGQILIENGVFGQDRLEILRSMVQKATAMRAQSGDANPPAPPGREAPERRGGPLECSDVDSAAGGEVVISLESVDVIVSRDRLGAFLRINAPVPPEIAAPRFMDLLASRKISRGVVSVETIAEFLQRCGSSGKGILQVAQGTPPKLGKDAEIQYLFSAKRRHGIIDGIVDLHDMGAIPQVVEGELLAEKIPFVKEENGLDVYGAVIRAERADDAKIKIGSGVVLSPDGLKAFAGVGGRPDLSLFGKLSVFSELVIEGDVDFETGNVEFEGAVVVRGNIRDGFSVRCRTLTAGEISKAFIDVQGNVTVYGGILGATVKSIGTVTAVHVYAAQVEAMGDVVVTKGVVDSKIVTSGHFITSGGTVLSSKIFAGQGMEIYQVGSERSSSSALVLGLDPVTEKEAAKLGATVQLKEQEKQKYAEINAKLQEQVSKLESRVGELVQLQDRGSIEQRNIAAQLADFRQRKDEQEIRKAEAALKELEHRIRSAGVEVDLLFEEQDKIRERVALHQNKMKEIDEEILALHEELDALAHFTNGDAQKPEIKILRMIYSGTSVRGVHAAMVFKTDVTRVRIMEEWVTDAEGNPTSERRIAVSSLR